MHPDTLTALQKSIAHWKRMRDNPRNLEEQPTAENCALCTRFHGPIICSSLKDDELCPVRIVSGLPCCEATPYNRASGAHFCFLHGGPLESWHAAADAEIDFLESLLP